MRKQVRIVLAVVLVAIAGVIVWQLLHLREPEPTYQGKRLSAWLADYCRGMTPGEPELVQPRKAAEAAVRSIGTNALPTLVKMLSATDSPGMSRLLGFWRRHVQPRSYLPQRVRYPRWLNKAASFQQRNAMVGLALLGADAREAIPALIELYERNVSSGSQLAIISALGFIGPDAQKKALPSYLRAAASTNAAVRETALVGLCSMEPEPAQVVPALISALNDPNWRSRAIAASGLGEWGTNVQQALPALTRLLSDSDPRVRNAAALALKSIDPAAAARAGVK